MKEILYRSYSYMESGHSGTTIVFKEHWSDSYYEEHIGLQFYEGELNAEINEISVKEVATNIAAHFVSEATTFPGVGRTVTEVNKDLEDLWEAIEDIYICILKATEQEPCIKDKEKKRQLIYERILWFFENAYGGKIKGELQKALIKEFVYKTRNDCNFEFYDPEEWYLRKIHNADEAVTTINVEQPF